MRLRAIDLGRWRFGSVPRRRVVERRIWIDVGGQRGPILQTKVQGSVGIRAIASGAALHLVARVILHVSLVKAVGKIIGKGTRAQALIGFPQRPQNFVPAG